MKYIKKMIGLFLTTAMLLTMLSMTIAAAAAGAGMVEYDREETYTTAFTLNGQAWNASEGISAVFGTAIELLELDITAVSLTNGPYNTTGRGIPNIRVTSNNTSIVRTRVTTASSTGLAKEEIRLLAMGEGRAEITVVIPERSTGWVINPADANERTRVSYEAREITFAVNVSKAVTKYADDEYYFDAVLKGTTPTSIVRWETSTIDGTPTSLWIDFTTEMAVAETAVVAFSTNGGKKWTLLKENIVKGTVPVTEISIATGTSISKILDKGGNVMFASRMEGKSAAPGATIWAIGNINPRPKSVKFGIQYGLFDAGRKLAVVNGENSNGKWYITVNGSVPEEPATKVFYATAFTDGKNADRPADGPTADGGINSKAEEQFDFKLFEYPTVSGGTVTALNGHDISRLIRTTDKPKRLMYLAKLAPVIAQTNESMRYPDGFVQNILEIQAGSKVARVRVLGETKPVFPKVDYKRDRLTVKAGISYWFDGLKDADGADTASQTGLTMNKVNRKAGIPFTGITGETIGVFDAAGTATSVPVTIWRESTGSKPRSMSNTILVWNYGGADVTDADITAGIKRPGTDKASFKLPKGFQVRENENAAWSAKLTVPATSASTTSIGEWQIRRIGTAKFDSKNPTTWISDINAVASNPFKLTFTYVSAGESGEGEGVFYLDKANVQTIVTP